MKIITQQQRMKINEAIQILVQEKQNRTMRRISDKPHQSMADHINDIPLEFKVITAIDPVTNLFERQQINDKTSVNTDQQFLNCWLIQYS